MMQLTIDLVLGAAVFFCGFLFFPAFDKIISIVSETLQSRSGKNSS